MQNTYSKKFDGINLHLEFIVKTKLIGKLVLSLFILLCFVVLVYLAIPSSKDDNGSSDFVVPIVIFTIVIVAFPVRYLIWNCYGKEYLIINTKTLSYYYSYHLINTTLKTKKYNKLSIAIEIVKDNEEGKLGRLVFFDENFKEIDKNQISNKIYLNKKLQL
ncbi:hypothetical protein NU10_05535 [Flavobacterium dauae]|uniref:hypothetical protein n=1 Tax=Flavobacterium dauae TaxID=1563479 RepID=UPI00101B34C9|nr:hypothetical protein [Flavobacterium dauae]WLD24841.1 hypothetical protein NU10_05535 [Flavobacterium dauae]